jgi:chorismate synthase
MAGAVAEKLIALRHGIEIVAWVSSVGEIDTADLTEEKISRALVDETAVRCPDADTAARMEDAILEAKADGDSLGGRITCVCRNVPVGLGEPVFGKVNALLAQAMLSIPSVKGFEIGSGFEGTRMRGSEHNDMFIMKDGRTGTATNRSGGVQGGISNGEQIVFKVAFKPVATIRKSQNTVDVNGKSVVLELDKGRHDPCVLPRAVPVVEAMTALVLADLDLQSSARR